MSVTRQAASAAASSAATSEVFVVRLIKACSSYSNLRQIHARIVRQGLEQDQAVISRFLCRCGAICRSVAYAREVFDRVAVPNLCLWNTLVKVHAECSDFPCTQHCLRLMKRREEVKPDGFTFPPILKSCASWGALTMGASLHGTVIRHGLEADVFVGTALVDLYGKCSDMRSAQKVFVAMEAPNVVSWTAMVAGYLSCGDLESARALFDKMPQRNGATWNAMIDGCVKLGRLQIARELFDAMPERDVVSFTSLLNGYAKSGDMASAESIFRRIHEKDVFSWSAMISGYAQNGQPNAAIKIFLDMLDRKVIPDDHVLVGLLSACSQLNCLHVARWADSMVSRSLRAHLKRPHLMAALIDMNAKCGNMERASCLFDALPERSLLAYCSMMQGYSFHGHGATAVELFRRLLAEGLTPDAVTFTVLLAACNYSGLVEEGRSFFHLMKEKYGVLPTVDHYACMVDLLARTGSLAEAHELILSMEEEPHAGVWGALLRGCCVYGAVDLGETAAEKLFLIEPTNAGNYVLLSNIYAAAGRWPDVCNLRRRMRARGIRKIPGCSWI